MRPVVLALLALLAAQSSQGRTWNILENGSGDAPTIQAAIDTAASGDTILVRAGTYTENLQTNGKALTLKALGSPETTIIDGNQQGSVVWATADVHIEGFTIRNGLNENGGGILVEGGSDSLVTASIVNNVITQNRAGLVFDSGIGGGVVLIWTENCLIAGNRIEGNYAGNTGGGLAIGGSPRVQIRDNVIVGNGCHVTGGGVYAARGTEIVGNLIVENWSDSFGAGISGTAESIRGNTIVGNFVHNAVQPVGAGIYIVTGSPVIERNIVVLNHGPSGRGTGVGIECGNASGPLSLRCNDVWGNDVDYNFVGAAECDTTGLGNFSADPQFCDLEGGNFELDASSPCAPENSGGCGLVGAYPAGCMVPVQPTTWGRIKAKYGN